MFRPMASPHDVPYRCLVPETVENLLMAGRCISTTHVAHSAGKSMGNCMELGQAAGTAAALSVQTNISPRHVDVSKLQDILVQQGVSLELERFNLSDGERLNGH